MSYGGEGTLLETRERFSEKPGSNGFESRLEAAVLSAVDEFSMTERKSEAYQRKRSTHTCKETTRRERGERC